MRVSKEHEAQTGCQHSPYLTRRRRRCTILSICGENLHTFLGQGIPYFSQWSVQCLSDGWKRCADKRKCSRCKNERKVLRLPPLLKKFTVVSMSAHRNTFPSNVVTGVPKL